MRGWRLGEWGMAVLVGLSVNAGANAADATSEDPPVETSKTGSGTGFTSWFSSRAKPPERKTGIKKNEPANRPPRNANNEAAKLRAQELATFLRRLEVCDQLRTIASRKGDDALMRRSDELGDCVWQAYTRRMAQLPGGDKSGEPAGLQIDQEPARPEAVGMKGARGAGTGQRNNAVVEKEVKP